MTTPPRPRTAPTNGQQHVAPGHPQKNINKTRVGGFNPSINLTVNEKSGGTHTAVGQGTHTPASGGGGGKVPGSDFMSNGDIRAFCEHHRKQSRNGATELAMDADHLESILRSIRDPNGTIGGSRARARRVTRWLKKAAAADKAKQKYFASLYATFEREFESNLRTVGKARQQRQATTRSFDWR